MFTSVRLRVRLTKVNRRAWLTVGLTTIGLAAAFFAQRSIYDSGELHPGVWGYGLAFALLAIVFVRQGRTRHGAGELSVPVRGVPVAQPETKTSHPARALLALPAYVFALVGFLELGGNEFTPIGTIAWLTGLVLFFVAFWESSPGGHFADLRAALSRQSPWVLLALAGIVLVGVFFYFYRLDVTPAEMTSDHAEKLLDTHDVLAGARPIFF